MNRPRRKRSLLTCMSALSLLLGVGSACMGQTSHHARWHVSSYDIPTGMLEVELDGAAVTGTGSLPDAGLSVSRRQLRLRVPDLSQLTRIELGGVALPLNRTEVVRDVFAARGRHVVVDLLVNGTYRMEVLAQYALPTSTLVAVGAGSTESLADLSMAALVADPYSPLPYRMLLRRDGDGGPLSVLAPRHRTICIGNVGQSLTATYSPGHPSGPAGRGINAPALFTLLASSKDRDDLAAYEDILIMCPGFAPAHARLAEIYYSHDEYGLAVLHLYRATAFNPGDAFGIDRDLRSLGGELRAKLAEHAASAAPHRGSAVVLRRTVESVLAADSDPVTRWHASIPEGIEDRAAFNTVAEAPLPPEDALQRALNGLHAAGETDTTAARHWNLLIMALTAGDPADAPLYDDARWRLSEMEPKSGHDRVLDHLAPGTLERDEVELARAFTALNPSSPVYANNLAVVYGRHGFLEAAIHELCRVLSVAGARRQLDGVERAEAYGTVIGNLAAAYRLSGREAYAGDLREVRTRMDSARW